MKEKYFDCVEKVSQILFEAIATREENLPNKILEIDTDLLSLLRAIGWRVMSMLLTMLISQVTTQAKKPGWKIQRRPQIKYTTIFGELEIESAYLWNKKLKKGIRPVAERLGITAGKHSLGLTRALADFGAEESFGQASLRFQEHYGFKIEVSKLGREVKKVARLSEKFVEERLRQSREKANVNPSQKTERILLELDGCHLRTGVKIPGNKTGLTKIRKIKKSSRKIDWKETRVAFARPVAEKKQRTFVAKMGKYPEILQHLIGAAYDRGLFSGAQIFAVADGGTGLKEALEKSFPGLQFILDCSHLKEHLYQALDVMELPKHLSSSVKEHLLGLIDCGYVSQVIKNLENYRGPGAKKIENLIDYLVRFQDCVHYEKFKSLGLPIGSGEIESAHKYIPQKRLKIAGATWHPLTINPMLALRIIRANNWWSEFWNRYKNPEYINILNSQPEPKLNLAN